MKRPLLYTGIDRPSYAQELERAMISVNTLERRKSSFKAHNWILDSGAFTRILTGRGHMEMELYAQHIMRWSACGNLQAAVAQDYMCEAFMLEITGMSVPEHQALSTENYLSLRAMIPQYIMPVIQGWTPEDYAIHCDALSPYLEVGQWTGVGSVCKRQGSPKLISAVLTSILRVRPDLRLHGFGVKSTALQVADISERFYSVDSMAWSFAGRFMDPPMNHNLAWAKEWAEGIATCNIKPSQAAML